MTKIVIDGTEYLIYGAGEDIHNPKPHMANTRTNEIPEGSQRGLLIRYLDKLNVDVIDGATTYWCIQKVLKLSKDSEKRVEVRKNTEKSKAANMCLPLTEANIEEQHRLVLQSANYGKEGLIIHDVLNAYPDHNDINTIAMKIAVIDVTNSTHLSQYKSQISLYDLAKVIYEIPDFDVRLAKGDPELVNIIARNLGSINMFSFASKYCTYHNVEVYGRDDYSIFDGIVKHALPNYVDGLSEHKIDSWRKAYDYVSFNQCIGKLLDDNKIMIPFRRRKFDHFLWYANK
ncbi:MAG: hypothetical protein MR992_08070 [Lachnospiraceae bacterium]|nr:hypothetical protein [Lachnospiraceae bacterium]MDD7626780.1 hypothetical protein [Lachnospiraceae bacterium]MDY4118498.1 hypothetical protein [Lachnospiraceae bacterium]